MLWVKDQEPMIIEDCRQRNDWPKWKYAIEAYLDFIAKQKVFGPIVHTPEGGKPVRYKWIFVQKRDENGDC